MYKNSRSDIANYRPISIYQSHLSYWRVLYLIRSKNIWSTTTFCAPVWIQSSLHCCLTLNTPDEKGKMENIRIWFCWIYKYGRSCQNKAMCYMVGPKAQYYASHIFIYVIVCCTCVKLIKLCSMKRRLRKANTLKVICNGNCFLLLVSHTLALLWISHSQVT